MLWKTLTGHQRDVSNSRYLIDWSHVVSKPQKAVKDFLRPYWRSHTVLEEFVIPATRMRVDLLNINQQIMVEVDGKQHDDYNQFMHGSLAGWRNAIGRDLKKEKWAELNSLRYVVIKQHEIPLLSEEWFKKTFDIEL